MNKQVRMLIAAGLFALSGIAVAQNDNSTQSMHLEATQPVFSGFAEEPSQWSGRPSALQLDSMLIAKAPPRPSAAPRPKAVSRPKAVPKAKEKPVQKTEPIRANPVPKNTPSTDKNLQDPRHLQVTDPGSHHQAAPQGKPGKASPHPVINPQDPHSPFPPTYKPGHKGHLIPPPRPRHYYRDWVYATPERFYSLNDIPDSMQLSLYPGQKFVLLIEEGREMGFEWFARYDQQLVDVDIAHKRNRRFWLFNGKRFAEIKIKGRNSGTSFIELIHANRQSWNNGEKPHKVVIIYAQTE